LIADSEYQTSELALAPLTGFIAGAAAALLMLAVAAIVQPLGGKPVATLLATIARLFIHGAQGATAIELGLAIHLLVGALCGWLYALSQQRAPRWALTGVGVFYGLLIWVMSSVIFGIFSHTLRQTFRNGAWLAACLVFGALLAGAAVLAQLKRPKMAAVVAKD
jgi:hypothetical protein